MSRQDAINDVLKSKNNIIRVFRLPWPKNIFSKPLKKLPNLYDKPLIGKVERIGHKVYIDE